MTAQQSLPIGVEVDEYNYTTFTTSDARGKSSAFKSIARVGEDAPDFSLPTPEGDYRRLSAFRGRKHVVLEFGSIT